MTSRSKINYLQRETCIYTQLLRQLHSLIFLEYNSVRGIWKTCHSILKSVEKSLLLIFGFCFLQRDCRFVWSYKFFKNHQINILSSSEKYTVRSLNTEEHQPQITKYVISFKVSRTIYNATYPRLSKICDVFRENQNWRRTLLLKLFHWLWILWFTKLIFTKAFYSFLKICGACTYSKLFKQYRYNYA